MKYFDVIPEAVISSLIKRGVTVSELMYCVKADMDGEGGYFDVYLTFSKDYLHIISGYETYGKVERKAKRSELIKYEVRDYRYIPMNRINKMYIDRYQNTARLMIEGKDGEYPIARFSVGFADKFEKFADRMNKVRNHEEIDDKLLEAVKTHCSICGEPYPDPNRPVCPRCIDRKSIFIRLVGMFKDFKFAIAGILIGILLSSAFMIITPYFGSKMLYDDVLTENGRFYGQIGLVIMIMAGVSLGGMIMEIISGIILSSIIPKVTHQLRTNIFSSMQRLSLSFFTSKQTGSLMTRVDRDSENVYWFFTDIVPYGLVNIAKIIGIIVIMFTLSPTLSLGILLMVIIINIIQRRFFRVQRKLYRKLNVAMRASNSVLSDVMNGQRVVKAFAREEQEIQRYSVKNHDVFAIDSMINSRLANVIPVIWLVSRVLSTGFYCIGAWMVIKGHLAFGALTALIAYTDMAYEPIRFFTWVGDRWARCVDAASRMFEILDAMPTVKESDHPVRLPQMKGEIEIKNVTFEYEAGRPIIKDASFKVESGQMFGIVGKTGAGKSTIINLIARLYDVTGGEILIDGVNIKEIAIEDLRNNIGIVSQETYIFMGSIADNIRYARPDASMEEVIEAAKSANAHEFITKLTDGYNTKIGEGGASLSGGEKQRISIARAIIQKPNILILDEATASMDTRTERKIQVAIDSLKEGRTIISIAHRLSTLRDADKLCVIEEGKVQEMGTHEELIREKGRYYKLYKTQAEALKFISME